MDFFKAANIDFLPQEVKILIWQDILRLAAQIQDEMNEFSEDDQENLTTYLAILQVVQDNSVQYFLGSQFKSLASKMNEPGADKAKIFQDMIKASDYISKIDAAVKSDNIEEKIKLYNSVNN